MKRRFQAWVQGALATALVLCAGANATAAPKGSAVALPNNLQIAQMTTLDEALKGARPARASSSATASVAPKQVFGQGYAGEVEPNGTGRRRSI